jgi:peptidyl-tRNA hydrolase, PTH1 family
MKLIVGLGNPGEKYIYTRHNIGFIILDKLATNLNIQFPEQSKFKGLIAEGNINEEKYIFLKPQTYMNLSGDSVRLVSDFYKIEPKDILVIHDDLDFEVAELKKQFSKNSAGHNGVQDIIEKLGTKEFYRLRVGIGRDEKVLGEDYVLRNMPKEDLEKIITQIDLDILKF